MSDTVSATVTTKVKGQGFLPFNAKKNYNLSLKDPYTYVKMAEIIPGAKYIMLDTAGKTI